MNEIGIFVSRLKKIGIDVELSANVPWIYLTKVNGNTVTEKLDANHGFTIAWWNKEPKLNLDRMQEIFEVIRKYR